MKLLLILLISVSACATTHLSAEDRAAKVGVVMECKNTEIDGKPYRKCVVLTAKGTETVTYRLHENG